VAAKVTPTSYCPGRLGDLDGHGAENARPGRENVETGREVRREKLETEFYFGFGLKVLRWAPPLGT